MRFQAVQNSTVVIEGTVYLDQDNEVVADITDAIGLAVIFKDNPKKSDSNALFVKMIGAGVTLTAPSNGIYQCIIDPEDIDISDRQIYFESVVVLFDGSIVRSGIEILYLNENVKHE